MLKESTWWLSRWLHGKSIGVTQEPEHTPTAQRHEDREDNSIYDVRRRARPGIVINKFPP